MRPRSIRQLSELDDAEFFKEIETGLRLCAANALRLWCDARRLLNPKRPQGFSILQHFAEEEAAKFHILLDAVKCPRQPGEVFSRQLGYFNAHLAKGLYATYYNIFAPADFPEIRRYTERERRTLYLDGPNEVDWIFQNEILRKREESIYVDYLDYNDANRRERSWHCPNARLMAIGLWDMRPKVLNVALALHGIGLTREAALRIVAQIWRAVPMDDSVGWNDIAALNLKTLGPWMSLDYCVTGATRIFGWHGGNGFFPSTRSIFPRLQSTRRICVKHRETGPQIGIEGLGPHRDVLFFFRTTVLLDQRDWHGVKWCYR